MANSNEDSRIDFALGFLAISIALLAAVLGVVSQGASSTASATGDRRVEEYKATRSVRVFVPWIVVGAQGENGIPEFPWTATVTSVMVNGQPVVISDGSIIINPMRNNDSADIDSSEEGNSDNIIHKSNALTVRWSVPSNEGDGSRRKTWPGIWFDFEFTGGSSKYNIDQTAPVVSIDFKTKTPKGLWARAAERTKSLQNPDAEYIAEYKLSRALAGYTSREAYSLLTGELMNHTGVREDPVGPFMSVLIIHADGLFGDPNTDPQPELTDYPGTRPLPWPGLHISKASSPNIERHYQLSGMLLAKGRYRFRGGSIELHNELARTLASKENFTDAWGEENIDLYQKYDLYRHYIDDIKPRITNPNLLPVVHANGTIERKGIYKPLPEIYSMFPRYWMNSAQQICAVSNQSCRVCSPVRDALLRRLYSGIDFSFTQVIATSDIGGVVLDVQTAPFRVSYNHKNVLLFWRHDPNLAGSANQVETAVLEEQILRIEVECAQPEGDQAAKYLGIDHVAMYPMGESSS